MGQVSLGFNAEHTHRDDVRVEIVSPAGISVQAVMHKYGFDRDHQNYDVLLYDAATDGLHEFRGDDDTAEPYFDRHARPHQPLRTLRGEDAAGTWTLTICDENPASDDGAYNRSRLVLRPQHTAARNGSWFYTQSIPKALDDVEQTLAIYGLDVVGNRTAEPVSLTLRLDNVAPVITVTTAVSQVTTDPNRTPITLLSGTVNDGGRVSTMYAFVQTPEDNLRAEQVARDGDAWWYDLQPDAVGPYIVWGNAIDEAGNPTTARPYGATIVEPNKIYLPLVMRDSES